MKKMVLTIAVLFAAVSVSFAGGSKEATTSGDDFAGNYAFGGSTTVEPIAVASIEAFSDIYPEAKISYDSNGSSTGIKGVIAGTYTLGGASRSLKDSEVEAGVVPNVIAYDGVAPVVNKASVPFDNIEMKDLAAIFAGDITNWSELGGPDAEIVVINRDEASGTRATFGELVVEEFDKEFVETAVIVTGNGDMVSKVGATPYSIGYCGFGYIGKDAGTKALSVDGVAPKAANVVSGTYSVSRSLIFGSMGEVEAGSLERAFLDFILSEEGQEIVAEEKFITLN